MTRINLIPVEELSDQHLLAEHREIKRIPNVILSWKYSLNNQPKEFTLWQWHVKFFYDKMGFLADRYIDIYYECIKRWFKVEYYLDVFHKVDNILWANLWKPNEKDIKISKQRIKEKLELKPLWYKWTIILKYKI